MAGRSQRSLRCPTVEIRDVEVDEDLRICPTNQLLGMEVKVEVPEYSPDRGLICKWEYGFEIETKIENGVVVIIANEAGLRSLANHFLNLAQVEIPSGHHLHLNEYGGLEEGSTELIIQKK